MPTDFFRTMVHYYWREGNKVVVQNMVAGMKGQEHRHTLEDFKQWVKKNKIKPECLVNIDEK